MSIPLVRVSPESVGISSKAILAFLRDVEAERVAMPERHLELHSLMVLRHGKVAAEAWWAPYRADDVHLLYSLSKSFTSTAIGMLVQEGRLSVEDHVLSFFPEDAPTEPSEHLRAMTVWNLLTMTTGQDADDVAAFYRAEDGNWVREFIARPVPYAPGSEFRYNSGATYMLSAILTKLTGESVLDYLRPRLFDPLGVEKATWESDPRGRSVGGWGLSLTTEAIARFGLLYLQNGKWESRQIIPTQWVEDATRAQVPNGDDANSDWCQGYGYQFWRCRHGAYRGDGAFGQTCMVLPEQDMVVVLTATAYDHQTLFNRIYTNILAACSAAPLPTDEAGNRALAEQFAKLASPGPIGQTVCEINPRVYRSDAGKTLRIHFVAGETHLVCEEFSISIGNGHWLRGAAKILPRETELYAAQGAWTAEDVYSIKIRFVESPAALNLTLHFEADEVHLRSTVEGTLFGGSGLPSIDARLI